MVPQEKAGLPGLYPDYGKWRKTYVNTLKEAFMNTQMEKEAEITLMQSMENTDSLPALTRGKISLDLNQKSLTEKRNASLINIRGAEVTVKTEPVIYQ